MTNDYLQVTTIVFSSLQSAQVHKDQVSITSYSETAKEHASNPYSITATELLENSLHDPELCVPSDFAEYRISSTL